MKGNNSKEHWDKCHKETGINSKFNHHFFEITKFAQGRVLNIAPGMSKNFMMLTMMYPCEYHALDISPVAVEFWKKQKVKAKVFDIKEGNKLPYPDDYFNMVITKSFLEHIDKPDNYYLAKEIKRVLKPMGIVSIMCASELFEGGPEPREHIYPTHQGGLPVKDLMDIYKEFRLLKYEIDRAEHYAVFRWG